MYVFSISDDGSCIEQHPRSPPIVPAPRHLFKYLIIYIHRQID